PRRQMQQDLLAVVGDAPGAEHRFARQSGVQSLGYPVDEQVGDREFAEVRPAKASYSCHSRSVTWLTAVRLSTLAPLASRKAASMSRVLSPRAYISTASCSSSAVRPARPVRTRETKVSARLATCGTPYSIAPSAVRSRLRRYPLRYPAPAPLRSRSSRGPPPRRPRPPAPPRRSSGRRA